MVRRTPQPASLKLTPDEMRLAVVRLKRRIEELEKFDISIVQERWNTPEVNGLQTSIEDMLAKVFGAGTVEYERYASAAKLDRGPLIMNHRDTPAEAQQFIREGIARSVILLKQAVKGFEEDLGDEIAPPTSSDQKVPTPVEVSNRVFVVHGHDDGAKEAMARFLSKAGLDPVVLHEKANGGRTVIEKLEHNSDVGFAVVILTHDDVGGAKIDGAINPRARQNVIAELFYFMGKLGRGRVCALMKDEVEIPSDIDGVVYVKMDDRGAWKSELLKELANLNYALDWPGALGAK